MKLAFSTGGANVSRELFESIKNAGIPALEISNGKSAIFLVRESNSSYKTQIRKVSAFFYFFAVL